MNMSVWVLLTIFGVSVYGLCSIPKGPDKQETVEGRCLHNHGQANPFKELPESIGTSDQAESIVLKHHEARDACSKQRSSVSIFQVKFLFLRHLENSRVQLFLRSGKEEVAHKVHELTEHKEKCRDDGYSEIGFF